MKIKFLFLLLAGACLTFSLSSVFRGSGQATPAKYTRPEIDFKHFPIADSTEALPSDPAAKARGDIRCPRDD